MIFINDLIYRFIKDLFDQNSIILTYHKILKVNKLKNIFLENMNENGLKKGIFY